MSTQGVEAVGAQTMPGAETALEVQLAEQRALVVHATGFVGQVIGREVTVLALQETVDAGDARSADVILARRGLRFLEAVGDADSPFAPHVQDDESMYAVAEGIITFGASNKRFLEMLEDDELTPAQATGMYALRGVLSEEFGTEESFPTILACLEAAGISIEDVREDAVAVAQQLEARGLIIKPARGKRAALATGDFLERILTEEILEDG